MTTFEREAYIGLADEFDAHGQDEAPPLDWFDPVYVEAAREFATTNSLPLPWELRSLDEALRLVAETERNGR